MLTFVLGASLASGLSWSAVTSGPVGAATTGAEGSTAGAKSGSGLLTLLSQTATVQPSASGPASFTLHLGIGSSAPSGATVGLTLYHHLGTRSQFQQSLGDSSLGAPLTHLDAVPVTSLPAAAGRGVTLTMDVVPSAGTTTGASPTLDLRCTPTQLRCTGVYPVVVSLYPPGQGSSAIDRFTTYLTYVQQKSTATAALRFAWVVPVAAPMTIKEGSKDPATAVAAPAKSTVSALSGLVTSLKQYPQVPVTLEASPQTLQALAAGGPIGKAVTQGIATMVRSDPSARQLPPESYVPIDLGAFAAAGETGEITGQMTQGAAALRALGVDAGSSRTWVATGTVGNALGTGLADPQVDATQLVVPDDQLAADAAQTTGGTWASTFQLDFTGGGQPVTAAAADTELAAHFTADRKDPALEVAQLLADVAMVHFEFPFATGRGVVAVAPAGWVPNQPFDDALLAGLATNPIVTPETLDGFFASVHQDGTRHLGSSGPGPTLPHGLAHQISTARLHLTGFDTAVKTRPAPVLTDLDQLLLASEAASLSPARQSAGVATFSRSLETQLNQITFASAGNLTLTARTGSIPITISSSAPYTVVGKLSVTSDKFQFPQGATRKLTLDHRTNPVRIQVEARTSGDLPIQAQLETSDGNLVIAEGQFTVRSTATSVVGVVLTAVALAVLLAWWARTWFTGRRRRRAAKGQRAAGG